MSESPCGQPTKSVSSFQSAALGAFSAFRPGFLGLTSEADLSEADLSESPDLIGQIQTVELFTAA